MNRNPTPLFEEYPGLEEAWNSAAPVVVARRAYFERTGLLTKTQAAGMIRAAFGDAGPPSLRPKTPCPSGVIVVRGKIRWKRGRGMLVDCGDYLLFGPPPPPLFGIREFRGRCVRFLAVVTPDPKRSWLGKFRKPDGYTWREAMEKARNYVDEDIAATEKCQTRASIQELNEPSASNELGKHADVPNDSKTHDC